MYTARRDRCVTAILHILGHAGHMFDYVNQTVISTYNMEGTLSFRLATPQDFDEVKTLSRGIYEGHDYLPGKYHHWLKQHNITIMLAVIADKIIGLEAQVVVDDGKTAVSRARRIHPDYRGRSYGTQLFEATRNHVRKIFPNVCRERLTTTHQRDASRNFRELLVQYTLACNIDKDTFERGNLPKIERQLTPCTREHFADVILSPPVVKNLFSNETLVIDWSPFGAIGSNIDCGMLEDGDQLFVEECTNEHLPMSFSHGRFTPKTEFQLWTCSIFTHDTELFKAHLIQQIETATSVVNGNFIFLSFQTGSMLSVGKEFMFGQAKLIECEHYRNEERMILYEKDW